MHSQQCLTTCILKGHYLDIIGWGIIYWPRKNNLQHYILVVFKKIIISLSDENFYLAYLGK
jgi:hypothetical protein